MSKNKAIYDLIKSMTGNEKRFFKIQSQRHTIGEKNNYEKLFDLYENMKEFDEKQINKRATNAPFIRNFPAEKNNLHHLILDCLDNYHRASNIDRQIGKLINIGRILMEKKQEDQAVKILHKARSLSIDQCRHENLIPINQLLIRKSFDRETLNERDLYTLHKEEQMALQHLFQKLEFRQTFDLVQYKRRMFGVLTDPEIIADLVREFPHFDEEIPDQFQLWDSGVYYLLSRLEFCRLTRKKDEGREIALRLLGLMEENKQKITGEYIDRYSYLLYVFVITHSYTTITERDLALQKLRNLDQFVDTKMTRREHARTFEYHYTTLTDILIKSKEYHLVDKLIPDFNRAEALYKDHLTPSFNTAMHFNIASLYFGMGEYRQALKWGNKVSMAALSFRKDIYHYLRTLNMVIHLELENIETLKSVIQAVQYFNKKNQIKSVLQDTLIKHINGIIKSNTKAEKSIVFLALKKDLVSLSNTPSENNIFAELDLISWIKQRCR